MSAAGKVKTGYSLPYVAKYSATGGSVSYTQGQKLARGVYASYDIDTTDDNKFYADNIEAENESGTFQSGTLNLTVDGLHEAAEKLIMGLPTAVNGLIAYDDQQAIPDVGVGFIYRYQSDDVITYTPVIFPRVRFNQLSDSGATQEDAISWQTMALTAEIKRSEDTHRTWKFVGEAQSTETAAEAVIKSALGISSGTT